LNRPVWIGVSRLDCVAELRRRFGAVSAETQTILGQWEQAGEVYRDEHLRLFVDVPDSAENREFFLQFKERLKSRFQPLECRASARSWTDTVSGVTH